MLVAVPALAIAVPLTLVVTGEWAMAPALIGAAACLFLCGLGLSSIVSAAAPYAVARPGDSPFQQPQRPGGQGAFGHAAALLGALVLSLPTLWTLFMDISEGGMTMATFWLGVGTGVGIALLGIVIGALLYDRRGARLMEFAQTT